MQIIKNIILVISLLIARGGLAQEKNLCICFEKDTPYIEVSIDRDSGEASFSITEPGYETEKQREAAYKRYQKYNEPDNYPIFTIDYLSYGAFDIAESFDSIPCAITMSVDEYRHHSGPYPNGILKTGTLMIKKINPKRFMVWEATLMPVE